MMTRAPARCAAALWLRDAVWWQQAGVADAWQQLRGVNCDPSCVMHCWLPGE